MYEILFEAMSLLMSLHGAFGHVWWFFAHAKGHNMTHHLEIFFNAFKCNSFLFITTTARKNAYYICNTRNKTFEWAGARLLIAWSLHPTATTTLSEQMQNYTALNTRLCLELDHFRAYGCMAFVYFLHNVSLCSVFFLFEHQFRDLIHVINQITPV